MFGSVVSLGDTASILDVDGTHITIGKRDARAPLHIAIAEFKVGNPHHRAPGSYSSDILVANGLALVCDDGGQRGRVAEGPEQHRQIDRAFGYSSQPSEWGVRPIPFSSTSDVQSWLARADSPQKPWPKPAVELHTHAARRETACRRRTAAHGRCVEAELACKKLPAAQRAPCWSRRPL